ncbi:MAG: glycosyltransferase family 39 protein [Halalkalicoccus sp.]
MSEEYAGETRTETETGEISLSGLLDDERLWLVVSLLAGSVVVASYYLTHPYPAYATALFPHMAELLIEHDYRRPAVVPHYTEGGIPFAYPPLMFYVMAVLIDLGVDPYQLIRLLPGVAAVLALIPYFYLAREFLPTRQAGFATVIIAVVPQVVRWHISGGGTVRSLAFLFVLVGLYVGVRLFRTEDRRWVLPGALLYGLTMLTHPVYMAYFGLSYLFLFAAFSRTVRGLLYGAGVAAGGALVGAFWWLHVGLVHGFETIANASDTHGGLFETTFEEALASVALFHNSSYPSELLIGFLVLAGGIYLLSKRRYVLPVWFALTAIVVTQQRFAFVPGAMLIAAVVAGGVVPWLAEVAAGRGDRTGRETVTAVALVALLLTTTWFGALYVTGDPPGEERNSMSSYVDDHDIEAMEWVASETPEDARFAVLGDGAEWFPYVAERTSLIGPWGVEWTTPELYAHHIALHADLTECDDAACVERLLDENEVEADYVYVPNERYTLGGRELRQNEEMRGSMIEHERYELVYENDGAMVFRVVA